ncbi:MAG: hypothetical protein SFV51_13350 [Bryobacteraceae bacterium]|nr:hypothetical protein [Bryobacteraceae bacterium]
MDRIRSHLTGWVLVGAILASLPAYRAALQPRYEWGIFGVAGTGMSAGYAGVLAAVIWAWATVAFGHRAPGRPFPEMLVAWNAFVFLSMVWSAYRHGSDMRLRGDALGMNIPLFWIGPALTGALLAASVYWAIRRPRSTTIVRWQPRGKLMLALALALGPVICVLFRQGDGRTHTDFDRAAVILVIAQGLLTGAGLAPAHPPPSSEPL